MSGPSTSSPRRPVLLAVLLAVLSAGAAAWASAGATAREGEPELLEARGTLELAGVAWSRDGVLQPTPPATPEGYVELPGGPLGRRWAFVFHTERAGSARLHLDWRPGPEGGIIEFVLDGERLSPARDGWRPVDTPERADLGTRWFGAGEHLVEIVAREAGLTVTRLRALELIDPGAR